MVFSSSLFWSFIALALFVVCLYPVRCRFHLLDRINLQFCSLNYWFTSLVSLSGTKNEGGDSAC